MRESMKDFTIRTWTESAKTQRKMARQILRFYPESPAAARSMGMARGIMLILRSIKGYETCAQNVNLLKRAEAKRQAA